MPPRFASRAIVSAAITCAAASIALSAGAAERISYNRDIRPILSENCFGCHGPDDHDRKAGLRFDVPQPDTPSTDSGLAAIVQGKPDESEVIARILSDDPDVVMP
ncbi:MAG: c-type cytochrome domain-containing protein, partial [Planctomycetia bacterium]